jgi:hypothetical protein
MGDGLGPPFLTRDAEHRGQHVAAEGQYRTRVLSARAGDVYDALVESTSSHNHSGVVEVAAVGISGTACAIDTTAAVNTRT